MKLQMMKAATACAAALSLWACGEEAAPESAPLEENADNLDCGGPSTAERYHDGITKTSESGRFSVTILTSDPAPPIKGDNTIELLVTEGEAPVAGREITVSPFMPHHNHGTAPADYVGVSSEDGVINIPSFFIFMPGYWEYTVTIQGEDGVEDQAVFAFCVEG